MQAINEIENLILGSVVRQRKKALRKRVRSRLLGLMGLIKDLVC